MAQIHLIGNTLPDDSRRIGTCERKAVHPEENEVRRIGRQILHEGQPHLVESLSDVVAIAAHVLNHHFRFLSIQAVDWSPILRNRRHQAVGIAIVVPLGMVVPRPPQA